MAKNKKKSHESWVIALMLGVIGIALLASSSLNLSTGAAIGTLVGKNLAVGFIGSILLIASLILFVISK